MLPDTPDSVTMVPIERIEVLNSRDRNMKVFEEIVENIRSIGLKKPITVTEREAADGAPAFLLVCGEGRLNAFRLLGETHIPALVVNVSDEDAFIMSLAENIARRGHRPLETGGDAAILSFNGNKIITTSGGGMLVTKHKDWADQARFLATQARDPAPHYEHSTYGYNYRLSNICAAIGLGQMQVLDDRVARRREIFGRYKAALERPGISFMPEPEGQFSTRWLTALTIEPAQTGTDRETVRLALLKHQIESRPLWKPMHMQPLYIGAPYHGSGVDERLFEHGLCLPSGSDMSDAQQDEVIGLILAVLSEGKSAR